MQYKTPAKGNSILSSNISSEFLKTLQEILESSRDIRELHACGYDTRKSKLILCGLLYVLENPEVIKQNPALPSRVSNYDAALATIKKIQCKIEKGGSKR